MITMSLFLGKSMPFSFRLGRSALLRARGLPLPFTTRTNVVKSAILSREEKKKLLGSVTREHVDVAARVLDQALTASMDWSIAHSDFLSPSAQEEIQVVLQRLADVECIRSGGYEQAERCRLSFGHPECFETLLADPAALAAGFPGAVSAIRIEGEFSSGSASHVSHGDFLGSVLGTGLKREKVGDIIVREGEGAHVFIVPELAGFLTTSLTQVRNVPVYANEIGVHDVQLAEQKVTTLRSVEASLRVDALGSAGFKMSRSKFSDLVSGGDVQINWRLATKGGTLLKAGDTVSVRGKGRLKIGDISTTKKGRYAVDLIRFV